MELFRLNGKKVAIHNFKVWFKDELADLICHTYLAIRWEGVPQATDEMRPEWFEINKIPYEKMWTADRFWMPRVLNGEKIVAHFEFDRDNNVLSHEIIKTDIFSSATI